MMQPKFEDYKDRYPHVRMKRTQGVLEVSLHNDGESLLWSVDVHEEIGYALGDIAADRNNHVVIIVGSGNDFCAEMAPGTLSDVTPAAWDHVVADGRRLIFNHLEIGVPIIAAVNGRSHIHSELALLADIVICDENASFRDAPHFPSGLVPGDGVHVVYQQLLGPNRGRYYMLTGQTIEAQEARELGLVAEVVALSQLIPRAYEIAAAIMQRSFLTRRYARQALTQQMKKLMLDNLPYGLVLEGMALLDAGRPEFQGRKNTETS